MGIVGQLLQGWEEKASPHLAIGHALDWRCQVGFYHTFTQ